MSSMNIMGTYSGIDMSTIDQLIEAESASGVRYTNQKTEYENEQTAWKDVNSRLDNLYKRLETMTKPETFNSKTVVNSNKDFVSVTANENAASGEYKVQVSQLATATRMTGKQIDVDSIEDELAFVGTESSTLNINGTSVEIGIGSSLKDVQNLINENSDDTKVKANIVDNRLVLSHTELGDKTITVTGDASAKLGLDNPIDSGTATDTDQTTVTQGQSALFKIDGIEIKRDSNTIEDVIEGVTFSLKKVHEGNAADTIKISEDTEKTAEAMKALVDQYNSLNSFIKEQLSVGDPSAEDNETGTLSGDSALTRLQTNLRSMFTRNMETNSDSINGLQDLGVEIDRYGVATFDKEVFLEKVEKDPTDVINFFHGTEETTETVTEDGVTTTKPVTKLTGFANEARSLVNEYISSTTGIIKTKSDTYDRLIKDINARIDTFNLRIESKREQYIKQFTALDTAMMQAESQLEYMMGQLGTE